MPINRGMDKEDMVHIYNGILLSHEKEWNWVICRDVDGPRDCHTEWSKSEREKQILHTNAYMWNVKKWYRAGVPNPRAAQQEVSGGRASEASSGTPHGSHYWLNHPTYRSHYHLHHLPPTPPSMEKLSSMKLFPGAQKFGDRWCRWSYLQSRNRDTDVENKRMDTKGEGRGWDELGDGDWYICTLLILCIK